MKHFLPNTERAGRAVFFIRIVLFLEIPSFLVAYQEFCRLTEGINTQEFSSLDLIPIIYLLAFIISAVCFLKWFRRAYDNLHLAAGNLKYTGGWAVGCWFVPILNIYRPYRIMQELHDKTKEILSSDGRVYELLSETDTLRLWWALWILTGALGQASLRIYLKYNTAEMLLISFGIDMVNCIVNVVLALITVKIIKGYSKAEELLAARFSKGIV